MSNWPNDLAAILLQNIAIPAPNLAGWWSCNTAGDYATALYDTSGNARHGVITDATGGAVGVSGKFLSCAGSQYATLADIDSNQLTLSLWVKTSVSSDIANKYGSAGERSWVLKLVSGKVVFQISAAGTTLEDFTAATDIADNAWHHVAVVYSQGAFLKIYVDGVQDFSTTDEPSEIHSSTASIVIGKGPNDSMTGGLDEVRVYTTALTASQVYYLYANPSPYEALPTYPGQEGFSETPQDGTIRGATDIGPGKTRQRFTSLATYMGAAYWLTRAQRLILDDFYKRVTRGGSLSFVWPHPDGYNVTARFASPPAYVPNNQDVTATISLEVLP